MIQYIRAIVELHKISDNLFKLTLHDGVFLAMETSIKKEEVTCGEDGEYYGWVVHDGKVHNWMHDFRCIDDTVYVVGPYMPGMTLESVIDNGIRILGYVNRIAHALALFKKEKMYLTEVHTHAIILLPDGGLLFFGNEVIRALCDQKPYDDHKYYWQIFEHPLCSMQERDDEQRYSFAVAALMYCALAGHRPWNTESTGSLSTFMRKGHIANIHVHDPYVRPKIVQDVHAVLARPKKPCPPLAFWHKMFFEYMTHGTHQSVIKGEAENRTRAASMTLTAARMYYLRKVQFGVHMQMLCVVGIFCIAIMTIPYALMVVVNRPVYRSLSPDQVVAQYYDSVDTLNGPQLLETLHPEYMPAAIRTVRSIYRSSRAGMMSRLQNPYLSPEEWIAAGKPRVGARYAVYGIDGMSLTMVAQDDMTAEVEAVYRYWVPQQFANGNMTADGNGNMTADGNGNMTADGNGNMTADGNGNMTADADGGSGLRNVGDDAGWGRASVHTHTNSFVQTRRERILLSVRNGRWFIDSVVSISDSYL